MGVLRDVLDGDDKARQKWIGIFIAILAVALAICSMGGDDASKDATLANVDATNTWAFFQAKNMRRVTYTLAADQLDLELKSNPTLSPEARRLKLEKLEYYRNTIKALTSEPKTGEGLDELWVKGKALEQARDIALRRDPWFDWGSALLQIAIVLASVGLVVNGNLPLYMSAIFGAIGVVSAANGFLLLI